MGICIGKGQCYLDPGKRHCMSMNDSSQACGEQQETYIREDGLPSLPVLRCYMKFTGVVLVQM